MSEPAILLAGGGTGGHVYPMIAVADALGELMPSLRRVFVGSSRGIETRVVPVAGYQLELIESLPLRGGGVMGAVRGALHAAQSIPQARRLVQRVAPRVVFSLGGYAAGTVSLAARTLGIPLALMEPNSVVGLANRLVAPWVQRAYIAFDEAASAFGAEKVVRSGVAIRKGFEPRAYVPAPDMTRILVLGGSQGAQRLNESVPEAVARVRAKQPLRVVHQAGRDKDDAVRERYAELGFDSATVVPFIDDVPSALATADLVIGRSGAGAVSEICAIGRPSLLVPYPWAAGDHQHVNAMSLVRVGAAACVADADAAPERLGEEITRLVSDRAQLARMADAARRWGRPNAANHVARDLLDLAGLGDVVAASGPRGVMRGIGAEEAV